MQAQVLLGKEDFVEKLRGYVQGYEAIAEIPRSQRYVSRPKLTKLFEGKRAKATLGSGPRAEDVISLGARLEVEADR